MNKKFESYEVSSEIAQIKHLLFFLGETFDDIHNCALSYRHQERESDKLLALSIDRSIDQLVTLQDILFRKVSEVEQQFDE